VLQKTSLHKTQFYTEDNTKQKPSLHRGHHYAEHNVTPKRPLHRKTLHKRKCYTGDNTTQGLDVNPNMVDSPRYMSYVRMDKWDEEATKWFENKAEANA
jgi:hypothetical protein